MTAENQKHLKRDVDWKTGYKRSELYLEHLSSCKVKSESIADIGTGLGGPALAFSKSNLTIGLDVSKKSLKSTVNKAKKQKTDKLHLMLASGTQLPIKDAYADLAVLTGTLEYFPRAKPLEDPEITHLDSLKDVNRILKENGTILLGIENRYWIRYWFGMKDFHSDLPFVTVLPRVLANLMCRLLKNKQYYLERLYSLKELTSLLENAGFDIVKVDTVLPDWMNCESMADIRNKKEVAKKLDAINPWKTSIWTWLKPNYNLCTMPKHFWKLLNSIGMLEFFCSNFIIIARKK